MNQVMDSTLHCIASSNFVQCTLRQTFTISCTELLVSITHQMNYLAWAGKETIVDILPIVFLCAS